MKAGVEGQRLGQLLGPAQHGGDRRSDQVPLEVLDRSLPKNRAHDFRKMAAHPDTVADTIDASTETHPASRTKVLDAIRNLEQAARQAETDQATWKAPDRRNSARSAVGEGVKRVTDAPPASHSELAEAPGQN